MCPQWPGALSRLTAPGNQHSCQGDPPGTAPQAAPKSRGYFGHQIQPKGENIPRVVVQSNPDSWVLLVVQFQEGPPGGCIGSLGQLATITPLAIAGTLSSIGTPKSTGPGSFMTRVGGCTWMVLLQDVRCLYHVLGFVKQFFELCELFAGERSMEIEMPFFFNFSIASAGR